MSQIVIQYKKVHTSPACLGVRAIWTKWVAADTPCQLSGVVRVCSYFSFLFTKKTKQILSSFSFLMVWHYHTETPRQLQRPTWTRTGSDIWLIRRRLKTTRLKAYWKFSCSFMTDSKILSRMASSFLTKMSLQNV